MMKYEELIDAIGKSILIYPLCEKNIRGSSVCLTSSQYAWSLKTKNLLPGNENSISIEPHDIAILLTNETISINKSIAGSCIANLYLSAMGLSMNSTLIDPGYTGRLLITFTNNSSQTVHIQFGDKIAHIRFHALKGETQLEQKFETWVHSRIFNTLNIKPPDVMYDAICREPAALLGKLVGSNEYKRLDERRKQKSILRRLRRISMPVILIGVIVGIYISSLPDTIKTAIPSIIALLTLIYTKNK